MKRQNKFNGLNEIFQGTSRMALHCTILFTSAVTTLGYPDLVQVKLPVTLGNALTEPFGPIKCNGLRPSLPMRQVGRLSDSSWPYIHSRVHKNRQLG